MSILGNGGIALTEGTRRYEYDRDKGWTTIRTWSGPQDGLAAIEAELIAFGYTISERQEHGGKFIVEASISGTPADKPGIPGIANEVVDTWELLPNGATKSILESNCSTATALSDDEFRKLSSYIKNRPETAPDGAGANLLTLIQLVNAGVENIEIDQPILEHTYTVPRNSLHSVNWTNLNKILSTTYLLANEGVPSDMQADITAAVAAQPDPTHTNGVSLNWGWRKGFPTITRGIDGKREVHIEYKFGLWSTVLYGAQVT